MILSLRNKYNLKLNRKLVTNTSTVFHRNSWVWLLLECCKKNQS